MNMTLVAQKKEWKPTHKMTIYEYNSALDTLDMLVEYGVLKWADWEQYRERIDQMVED